MSRTLTGEQREMLADLRHLREQAEKYSLSLSRRCRRCGYVLTEPRSILRETGRACAKKLQESGPGDIRQDTTRTATNNHPKN